MTLPRQACGQHHIADIGLLGVSRSVDGRRVPHFQIVLGGDSTRNAVAFGLATVAVPSKNVPAAGPDLVSQDGAQQCIEEATLFIEAAHACYHRISAAIARTQ